MRKLNLKNIAIISALTLSMTLTGCQSKEEIKDNQVPVSSQYEEDNSKIESSNNTEVSMPETAKEEDFTFFKDAKQEITNYIESEEYEQLKEKGKYYVTTGIDFIFFDEPINGLYFDDLTEELKEDIIRDVKSLDEAIMAYFPNYKESFQTKYQVASEFISEKYLDVLDSIKEYLGEENYNAIGDIKDQLKEDFTEKKDNALTYIKDKYQEWKNK